MSTYKSRFSGVMIDRAVAYFNAIDTYGRMQQKAEVTGNSGDYPWVVSTDSNYNYQFTVDLTGIARVKGEPPIVYFIDSQGARWDLPYKFTTISGTDSLICYSNIDTISGNIIIVSSCSYQNLPSRIFNNVIYSSSWTTITDTSDPIYVAGYTAYQDLPTNSDTVNADLASVSSHDFAIVVFSAADSVGGNLAPVADTIDGGVRIYAKDDTVSGGIIPTIVIVFGDM